MTASHPNHSDQYLLRLKSSHAVVNTVQVSIARSLNLARTLTSRLGLQNVSVSYVAGALADQSPSQRMCVYSEYNRRLECRLKLQN